MSKSEEWAKRYLRPTTSVLNLKAQIEEFNETSSHSTDAPFVLVPHIEQVAYVDAAKLKETLDANTVRLKNLLISLCGAYEALLGQVESREKVDLNNLKETIEAEKSEIINQMASISQQIVDALVKITMYVEQRRESDERQRATLEKLDTVLDRIKGRI